MLDTPFTGHPSGGSLTISNLICLLERGSAAYISLTDFKSLLIYSPFLSTPCWATPIPFIFPTFSLKTDLAFLCPLVSFPGTLLVLLPRHLHLSRLLIWRQTERPGQLPCDCSRGKNKRSWATMSGSFILSAHSPQRIVFWVTLESTASAFLT